jgi:endoglucanase
MLVNQNTFNLKSTITDDWGGSHRVMIDLETLMTAKDWKIGISIPDGYKINQIYGAEVTTEGNKTYISGVNGKKSLNKGDKTNIVLIVDEGTKSKSDPIKPQFLFADVISNPGGNSPTPNNSSSALNAGGKIVEDWNGGYKFTVDLKANSAANNWKANFNLPYNIREAYGVNLVKNSNGSYTISGQNDQVNLKSGQTIKPIFIVDDGGKEAILPKFDSSVGSSPKPTPTPNPGPTIPGGEGKPVGQRGKFAYGEALQKNFLFFEANRSGDLGPDNRLEWRKDSTLKDGSTVGRDLEGGYFDAGDHVKFGQPMAFSINMLAWGGVEYKEAYKQSGQLDELLEAVKWGTDYFLKAHETDSSGKTQRLWVQVGQGGSQHDHGNWGPPETVEQKTYRQAFAIDRAHPGTDVASLTSSALASASMLFRGVDNAYADKLLQNAKQLYEFAETYQGKYSDSVTAASPFYTSWSGYGDELVSGAAWLHKATGDKSYLTKAENYFKTKIGGLGDWSWAADDQSYGAAVILAQKSSDPFFKGQVEGWLNKWINGGGNIKYTPGGFAHRAAWASVPITGSVAFLAELYNDTVKQDSRYSKFATRQTDYILGDNPKGFSYMVGFGRNSPQRPHHRGSAGSQPLNNSSTPNDHILYGAIVGGPGKADDYSHNDRRDDWITNEVGTGYNAPIASALIQQYQNFGGDALSESALDQLIGVDANGVGF